MGDTVWPILYKFLSMIHTVWAVVYVVSKMLARLFSLFFNRVPAISNIQRNQNVIPSILPMFDFLIFYKI